MKRNPFCLPGDTGKQKDLLWKDDVRPKAGGFIENRYLPILDNKHFSVYSVARTSPMSTGRVGGEKMLSIERSMGKKPKPIRSVLDETLRALGIDAPIKNYSLFGAWKEIVGETIALQTQPRSLRNQILFVDVSHSTWIQQLQFLKPQLLEKLNAFLGEPQIKDIRFKLGKISSPSLPSSPSPVWPKEPLDKGTLDRMDELLGRIEDKEMRDGLRNILVKGAKLERHRKKQK